MRREEGDLRDAGPLTALARQIVALRGSPPRFWQAFDDSLIPIVMVDRALALIEANHAARLLFRSRLDELRGLRLERVLSSAEEFPKASDWEQALQQGSSIGTTSLWLEHGFKLTALYWLVGGAVPGEYLLAISPAGWSEDEWTTVRRRSPLPSRSDLSEREREVLSLVAAGLTVREIAGALTIASSTVETHLGPITRKLGARNRAHAVALGFQGTVGDPWALQPPLGEEFDWLEEQLGSRSELDQWQAE